MKQGVLISRIHSTLLSLVVIPRSRSSSHAKWIWLLLLWSALLLPARAQIVINEIMADNKTVAPVPNSPDYFPDYVELYNNSDMPIDLGMSGWRIGNRDTLFAFTAATIILPRTNLLVFCDSDATVPGVHTGFGLSATKGDGVYLFLGLTVADSQTFGIKATDYSIGRIPDVTGAFQLNIPTPGEINASVILGTPFVLKINEWLATNSLGPDEDWFEIYNPSSNAVSLTGLVFADRGASNNNLVPFLRSTPPLSFIAPMGWVQIFASDKANDADEVDFSLSSGNGDEIWIFASNSLTGVIDHVSFNSGQVRNITEGRLPDGESYTDTFGNNLRLVHPSPGSGNVGQPTIITDPLSQTAVAGSAVVFTVAASVGQFNYQWEHNGVRIPGATNATYKIPIVTDSDAGNYVAVVSAPSNRVTSAIAILTVINTPVFVTSPSSQAIELGADLTLSAMAYGAPPLVFQWQFKGLPTGLPTTGNNVSSYTLKNVQLDKSGDYSVEVFNGYGSATSLTAVVSVVVFPPSITIQPVDQILLVGKTATFAVSVSGTPPFKYWWQHNGSNIPGGTNTSFSIPAIVESDAGSYSVVVMNSAGSATSESAALSVIAPPQLGLRLLAGYPLLSLSGPLGSNFTIQHGPGLHSTNWLSLRSISNLTVSPLQFLDTSGSSDAMRYYRAVMW